MKKAVFLDRDGVINKEVDVLRSFKQLRLLPGVAQAIRQLNKLSFLIIIVTNQPVIARGWLTEEEVDAIHNVLIKRLVQKGARIDVIYYCPHHSENENCICRKPKSQLLEKSIARFSIDKSLSFFIGDSERDVEAAKNVGMKGIKIESNSNLMQLKNNLI